MEAMGIESTESHEELRPLLFSIAYRMIGSVAEAEDVVQEAFLRYHQATLAGTEVENPKAYLSSGGRAGPSANRRGQAEIRSIEARTRRAGPAVLRGHGGGRRRRAEGAAGGGRCDVRRRRREGARGGQAGARSRAGGAVPARA